MQYIRSFDASARDSGIALKRRGCLRLFNQQGLFFSHSFAMSSTGLEEVINVGYDQ